MKPRIRVPVYEATTSQVARALLLARAYRVETSGDRTQWRQWKSGIWAPVYLNCRDLFGHAGQRGTVVRALASSILDSYPTVTHIIGIAEAGIVWGSGAADVLGLPFAYVSKTQKEHGVPGLVVGIPDEDSAHNIQAVVVDDLVASGGSLENAIEALTVEKQIKPIGIQSIVHWDFQRAHSRFERLKVPVSSLVSYPHLLRSAVDEGLLSSEAVAVLSDFYRNPFEFDWDEAALLCLSSKITPRVSLSDSMAC